jgi:hypothetical protein
MCVLCGQMFTEIHWSERLLDPETVSQGGGETLRRQSRHARTRLIGKVLAHYGLDVSDDWSAMNYVVGNRKGTQQVVGSLAELWPAAARMAGRTLDPLDPALLDCLRAAESGSCQDRATGSARSSLPSSWPGVSWSSTPTAETQMAGTAPDHDERATDPALSPSQAASLS